MTDSEREQMRAWVETWQRAGAALERIKRQELRAYDYSRHQAAVDGMLRWACANAKPRLTSGLVEQQRLFAKLREKQGC